MSIAWVVSQKSENQDIAWQFLGRVLHDPQVLEWLLANGFLPIDPAGFIMLQENEDLVKPWLDTRLIQDDLNLEVLRGSSEASTIWQLPAKVPAEVYNERVIPKSMDLLNRVFNGITSAQDGFDEWKQFLMEIGLGS